MRSRYLRENDWELLFCCLGFYAEHLVNTDTQSRNELIALMKCKNKRCDKDGFSPRPPQSLLTYGSHDFTQIGNPFAFSFTMTKNNNEKELCTSHSVQISCLIGPHVGVLEVFSFQLALTLDGSRGRLSVRVRQEVTLTWTRRPLLWWSSPLRPNQAWIQPV